MTRRTIVLTLAAGAAAGLLAACGGGSSSAPGPAPAPSPAPAPAPAPVPAEPAPAEPTPIDQPIPIEPGPGGSPQADLDAARDRWEALGLGRYVVDVAASGFIPRELLGPFRVTVEGGKIVDLAYAPGAGSGTPPEQALTTTVEALFDRIQEAIDTGADEVRVSYDGESGIPVSVWIDQSQQMADEEIGFELTLVEPSA